MRHVFLDAIRVVELQLVDRRQVAIENDAAREQERVRITHAGRRQVTDTQEVAESFAAFEPVAVKTGDRQRVGHVGLRHERLHAVNDVLHLAQALAVDRRVRVQVDRARYAADDEIRVRVLATEDRMQSRDVTLPDEGIEVVRDRHQVRFRRQPVLRVAPVSLRKNSELTLLDEVRDFLLYVREIADRGSRVIRHRLCQRGRRCGVRFQRRHDVHPVQRVQVIEVHDVVVDVLRTDHQVADQFCIFRHFGTDGVLHGAYRRHAVHERADAADALRECPGIARVAVFENDLDSPDHRARRVSLGNLVAVHLRLDAKVPLDSRDRVYNDSFVHRSSSTRLSATVSSKLPIVYCHLKWSWPSSNVCRQLAQLVSSSSASVSSICSIFSLKTL